MPTITDRPSVTPRLDTQGQPTTNTTTNTAATTATTSTTATDVGGGGSATGLDGATHANPAPQADVSSSTASGAGQRLNVPGLQQLQQVVGQQGPSKLELLAGYPQCVSLTTVMKAVASSPQGAQALDGIFAKFEAETGTKIPDALKAVIKAHPERIADALVLTPSQMARGFDGLQVAARSGKLKPTAPKVRQLDAKVDLGKIDLGKIKRPEGELKELAPGLFQGDVKSDLADDLAKKNIVAAEVMDRLAGNALTATKDDFKVVYAGHTFTTVDGFLDALRKDGHEVSVSINYRAADFASLKVKNPQAPQGVLDVPAAILVATGVTKDGPNGKQEAVLPAIHGELVFDIKKGPNTKGPGFEGSFKWYQGVPNTGFAPVGLFRSSTWNGKTTTASYTGDDAVKMARLAGHLGDVINTAASKSGLWMNGYGQTGVCLDSVGIIEQVMTGKASGFPLFMKDDLVNTELKSRANDKNRRDDKDLRLLADAIAKVPSDDKATLTPADLADRKARALASLPWSTDGKRPPPPVQCVADAIAVLT